VIRQARATDRTPASSGAAVGRRLLPFQEKGWFVFLLVRVWPVHRSLEGVTLPATERKSERRPPVSPGSL
jgi:hypothetical protein